MKLANKIMRAGILVASIVVLLAGCSTTQHAYSNMVFHLGKDAKPGETAVVLVQSGVFEYPRFARYYGIEGKIILEILVTADGKTGEVRVLKRELNKYRVWVPGREGKWDDVTHIFDEPADDLLKTSVWKPATRDGQPIAMWVTMPMNFSIAK